METSYIVLVISAASLAFFHSLAPDHWLPFVLIGQAQQWTRRHLLWVTLLGSLGHVGSSLVLGATGILLGLAVAHLEGVDASRGHVAILLLIGFGVAYAVWGLKHAGEHHHHHHHLEIEEARRKTITVWALVAVVVLGPCEPLIPLMFLANRYGWSGLCTIAAVFSVVTIGMMVGQSYIAYIGVDRLNLRFPERYLHAITGGVVALTGLMVLLLGI